MLILCLELIKSRLGVMNAQIRELFFIIIKTLIEKSPVGYHGKEYGSDDSLRRLEASYGESQCLHFASNNKIE